MLQMLRDLVDHKGHANAAMLNAIRQNAAATVDPELLELLHHVLLANRFWLRAVLGLPFVLADESRPADSFDALVRRYAQTQTQEIAWLATAKEADLDRTLTDPLIPNGECSVAQAIMQVCLHAHGHRAQCAKLLRRHNGTPPATDFILWLTKRPGAEWPETLDTEAGRNLEPGPSAVIARDADLSGLLDRFADAWNRHDLDALMSMMTDDCVFEASAGPRIDGQRSEGKQEVRAAYAAVFESFQDSHWAGARHFIAGHRGVSEWTFTGTQRDGKRVEVSGCDIFTFSDGRIAVKNSYRKNRPAI